MRELARTLVDEPYRLLIVNMVNIIVGCGAHMSKGNAEREQRQRRKHSFSLIEFWRKSIKDDLTAKFGKWNVSDEELSTDFNLSKYENESLLATLAEREERQRQTERQRQRELIRTRENIDRGTLSLRSSLFLLGVFTSRTYGSECSLSSASRSHLAYRRL